MSDNMLMPKWASDAITERTKSINKAEAFNAHIKESIDRLGLIKDLDRETKLKLYHEAVTKVVSVIEEFQREE